MRQQNSPNTREYLLPPAGFLRLSQILGSKSYPPIIPVSRSTWFAGVKSGKFPRPVKLGERTTAWRVDDIVELIERLSSEQSV